MSLTTYVSVEYNSSTESIITDPKAKIQSNQATDDADFLLQWKIQVTVFTLLAGVGIFVLIVFLVSLYCGKKAFRKMQIDIVKPSRMKNLWFNHVIIPFRPVILFHVGHTPAKTTEETKVISECFPTVTKEKLKVSINADEISEYGDAVEEQDADVSSMCEDGFSTPQETRKSMHSAEGAQGRVPIKYCTNANQCESGNCEDYIFYKVINI